jgi:DNA-binding NtrC family response regulator
LFLLPSVLETGELRPLGSARARRIDVRFIAATDANLEGAIASSTFSEALYHRLARYLITIPPLRARREDFGVLLIHFLHAAFQKYGEPDRVNMSGGSWLHASSVAALSRLAWPGNVRDLDNVAGQIVAFSRGQQTAAPAEGCYVSSGAGTCRFHRGIYDDPETRITSAVQRHHRRAGRRCPRPKQRKRLASRANPGR